MGFDHGILNLPLAKRGDIDKQIDAHKAALKNAETKETGRDGVTLLCKGGHARVFANRTQAEAAAARTGGEAFQSRLSNRFMVRFEASAS